MNGIDPVFEPPAPVDLVDLCPATPFQALGLMKRRRSDPAGTRSAPRSAAAGTYLAAGQRSMVLEGTRAAAGVSAVAASSSARASESAPVSVS